MTRALALRPVGREVTVCCGAPRPADALFTAEPVLHDRLGALTRATLAAVALPCGDNSTGRVRTSRWFTPTEVRAC